MCPLSVFFRTICDYCHQPVVFQFSPRFHPALSCLSEGLDVALGQTCSDEGWVVRGGLQSHVKHVRGHCRRCQKWSILHFILVLRHLISQHLSCTASVRFAEKRRGTAFQKHKRKSSFVSSGKRYSLVGISFHCPRTICLLKQEERRAKIHAEETLRFLRTDSVWICQLFAT